MSFWSNWPSIDMWSICFRFPFNKSWGVAFIEKYVRVFWSTKDLLSCEPCPRLDTSSWKRFFSMSSRWTSDFGKQILKTPQKMIWRLEPEKIIQLKRKMIFQTSIFRFHVNFRGAFLLSHGCQTNQRCAIHLRPPSIVQCCLWSPIGTGLKVSFPEKLPPTTPNTTAQNIKSK